METDATGVTHAIAPVSRAPLRGRLAALDRRRVTGLVLVVGWVVWLALAWVAEVRLVPVATLDEDLGAGRVVAFREVLLEPPGSDDGWVESPGIGYWTVDSLGRLDDDSAVDGTGASVTVTYWVDGPVANQRVLDLGGDRAAAAAAGDRLREAGVPPDLSFGSDFIGTPDRDGQLAWVLALVTFGLIVLGPRPGRGTRWFWFWLLMAPLGLGVLAYAVVELVRPGRHRGTDAGRGRYGGLAGLLVAVLGSVLIGELVSWLAEWAPLVLRP
jgi:hypothetical protein